ncbi:hypothetical protein BK412_10290 [Vibrio campbellii]|nr:hypothetical protein BK412_10290 [Vibrio campbellii]
MGALFSLPLPPPQPTKVSDAQSKQNNGDFFNVVNLRVLNEQLKANESIAQRNSATGTNTYPNALRSRLKVAQ